ncbi:ArsR/SmtB family transcription factor [Aureivirga sp. CE67]|uniref:ArsR/SmtB family transcription factor n=1 Tax=Aureivirga sp. CE67 TaxID=1788983 RepID=UPI0018CB8A66|nr:metalloregulator ArsR/SmtB family transcription factor [Aureivirga sp. CE67]
MKICSYIYHMNRDKIIEPEKVLKVAEILKTIGHPIRLQVLEVLEREEPLTVSQILENINLDVEQSLLSHHLIKMKDKGILSSEKQGMHMYYRVTDRKILSIFDCMSNCSIV